MNQRIKFRQEQWRPFRVRWPAGSGGRRWASRSFAGTAAWKSPLCEEISIRASCASIEIKRFERANSWPFGRELLMLTADLNSAELQSSSVGALSPDLLSVRSFAIRAASH